MAARWIEKVTGSFDEKRDYRRYKARVAKLPPNYRSALEALNRYFMYYAGVVNGGIAQTMLNDLADLFEQSAADGTSVRAIVGEDPVEFAEDFVALVTLAVAAAGWCSSSVQPSWPCAKSALCSSSSPSG